MQQQSQRVDAQATDRKSHFVMIADDNDETFSCLTIQKNLCFEYGAVAVLDQPVDPEALYRAVQIATETNPRSSIRVRTLLPVRIHGNGRSVLADTYAAVLSTGGMFLRTERSVDRHVKVSLDFTIKGQAISTDTEVIYNCVDGGGPFQERGVGLKFLHISPKDKVLIRDFIKSEVLKGMPCPNR